MDGRRKARQVDNATNRTNVVCNQESVPVPVEAGSCSCRQRLVSGSEPPGSLSQYPAGAKFDPTDEELLHHLMAETGQGDRKPHALIRDFISVLDGDDGICRVHPEKLPGVYVDGRSKHFFHRPAKAYNSGNRKRRKIHTEENDESGVETRWHKTGKTREVSENGVVLGWKKIMVLYSTGAKKSKPEKTNWILHQYHLGENDEEKDGELVVCKVFYQRQPRQCTGGRPDTGGMENEDRDVSGTCTSEVSRGTPVPRGTTVKSKGDTQRLRSSRADANGERRGQTASSKGSELTVIGMEGPAAVASELTSTPAPYPTDLQALTPAGPSFPSGGQVIPPNLKTSHSAVVRGYSEEWNGEEEVSESAGKLGENGTDNQVGGGVELMERDRDEPQPLETFCPLQQLQDEDLNCPEQMSEIDLSPLDNLEDIFCSNPNPEYPDYTDTEHQALLGSLPFLDPFLHISSQEATSMFECYMPAYDNNDDSLSST